LLALERQGPPGRAGGGEEPHLFGGEVALLEQGAQHGADLPGRSDDSDPYTHRPVPPYTTASTSSASSPNAACTARTASSSWWMPTMTESRISEVEIISMLMPASRSAPNNRAETPGCERMPAPTSESLPTFSL